MIWLKERRGDIVRNIRTLSAKDIEFNGNYFLQMVTEKTLCNIPHKHDFYELICVLSSSCVQNINEKRRTLYAQSFVFLSPFDEHFCDGYEEDASLFFLSVKTEEMQSFLSAYGIETLNSQEEFCLSNKDITRLKQLYVQSLMCPENQLIFKSILTIFLSRVLERKVNCLLSIPKIAVRIAEEMNDIDNLREGLPALLRISGYSYCQLWRLMKQWFHMTPKEYINQLRMEHAYIMIITGDWRVEDIADCIGFSSLSHFNVLIKQHYGYTASELRKKATYTEKA